LPPKKSNQGVIPFQTTLSCNLSRGCDPHPALHFFWFNEIKNQEAFMGGEIYIERAIADVRFKETQLASLY
jgi:hypothetical protein